MGEYQPPIPNAEPLPVADITADDTSRRIEYEAYPVRKPEEDLNDFRIQVRASTLDRCRAKLAKISSTSFPWYEVFLGIATTALGASLGSLSSDNISPGSLKSIFFYTILPIIAVTTFVIYLFRRKSTLQNSSDIAVEVLSELPDPAKTR